MVLCQTCHNKRLAKTMTRLSPSPTPIPRNPNRSSRRIPNRRSSSSAASSSSPSSSLTSLLPEPSPNFFPSASELLRLLAAVAIAVSAAAACHYFVSSLARQDKPFCDSDSSDFDDSLSHSCEPCPRHGQCYEGHLKCVPGYRKYGRICVEDGVINEAAKRISEWVENHLCHEYAQFMCDGKGIVWVSVDELENDLDLFMQRTDLGLDNTSYISARERALEVINILLDVRMNVRRIKEFKCPDDIAEKYKRRTCLFRQRVAKHALILVPASALLVSCIILLLRIHRRWYLSKRAEQLYHRVCDILEESALMSKDINGGEPWLVSSRLRDHLLSPRERRDPVLWKKVQELVNEDSRVECYPKIVKGESKVVWEWQVEGSLSFFKQAKETSRKQRDFWGANELIFSLQR